MRLALKVRVRVKNELGTQDDWMLLIADLNVEKDEEMLKKK